MSGLDDLIGSLAKKSGSGGAGIEDLLGGLLGGGSGGPGAGGGGLEDLLGGLLELIERDAVALWWLNRLPRPAETSATSGRRAAT